MTINDKIKYCAYVDGNHLWHRIGELGFNGLLFDLKKYLDIRSKSGILKSVYYSYSKINGKGDDEKRQKAMINEFKKKGWNCVEYIQRRINGDNGVEYFHTKGDDVGLAWQMAEDLYKNNLFDIAILVTGDGDFLEPIKKIKEHGKEIELVYFPGHVSQHLINECNDVHEINVQDIKDLKYEPWPNYKRREL